MTSSKNCTTSQAKLIIRCLNKSDIKTLKKFYNMHRKFEIENVPSIKKYPYPKASSGLMKENLELGPNFGAFIDGKMIGTIAVEDYSDFDQPEYFIARFFVLEEFRNQGIGKQLFKTALNYCNKNIPIKAIAYNSNEKAFDFYEKQGFTPLCTELILEK